MSFAELTDRAQVRRLRAAAMAALAHYPIQPHALRLLCHDFNTTFRLDTAAGERYAVRISVNRRKPVAALDAELAWLDALARDTEVVAPVPLATLDGRRHVPVEVEGVDGPLHLAVLSWLPGRDLDVPTVPAIHELGRQMALLHEHASRWEPPPGAEFPAIDTVLMDSPDRLRDDHPAVSDEQRELLLRALDRIEPAFDAMIAAGERMPIHGDLHPWNVKWLRGRMALFDFDDAGLGVPAQDLAITRYYLPDDDRPGDVESALLAGYRTRRELPPCTTEQLHAALAARTLLLLNDLLDQTAGESRGLLRTYLGNVEHRMRAYLGTGVYRLEVPGVVPLP